MDSKIHVLIVNDDREDSEFLSSAFSAHHPGTRFSFCKNGDEALVLLNTSVHTPQFPDVAFLDLHMPGKNGLQVLTDIRANPAYAGFPVMVISTSLQDEEAVNCRKVGCNEYFSKPHTLQGYDAIVQTTLRHLNVRSF